MALRPRLLSLALLALAAPAAVAQTAPLPLAGRWTYRVEVPGRTVEGVLAFADSSGVPVGKIASAEAPDRMTAVHGLRVDADGTARFWIDGPAEVGRVDFAVRAAGAALSGQMTALGYGFPLAGARAAEAPAAAAGEIAGTWQYVLETPQGASNGQIEITKNAEGSYAGRVVREGGGEATALSSVTRDGSTATLVYPSGRYGTLTMRLTVAADAFTGTLLVGESELPVRGTRLPR